MKITKTEIEIDGSELELYKSIYPYIEVIAND